VKPIVFTYILIALFSSTIHSAPSNPKTMGKDININADMFEVDAKANIVVASGNVVVKQKDVTLYGKKALYNQKKQLIKVIDGVRMVRGDMLLTCNQANADGANDIIKALGNVYFTFSNIKGTAENAKYNLKTQTILLLGKPHAWKGKDEIFGETIYIDLKEEKITTRGKAKVIISEETLQTK
jgi:lipopolysaccharide transport protein LptA